MRNARGSDGLFIISCSISLYKESYNIVEYLVKDLRLLVSATIFDWKVIYM